MNVLFGISQFVVSLGELIHPFVLAINYGASSEDVARKASRGSHLVSVFNLSQVHALHTRPYRRRFARHR